MVPCPVTTTEPDVEWCLRNNVERNTIIDRIGSAGAPLHTRATLSIPHLSLHFLFLCTPLITRPSSTSGSIEDPTAVTVAVEIICNPYSNILQKKSTHTRRLLRSPMRLLTFSGADIPIIPLSCRSNWICLAFAHAAHFVIGHCHLPLLVSYIEDLV